MAHFTVPYPENSDLSDWRKFGDYSRYTESISELYYEDSKKSPRYNEKFNSSMYTSISMDKNAIFRDYISNEQNELICYDKSERCSFLLKEGETCNDSGILNICIKTCRAC